MVSVHPSEEEIIERMKAIATEVPGVEDMAWNLKEQLLAMSANYQERRNVFKVVVDQVELLVVYRLLNGDHAFEYFIAELYANGMAVRERDKIRKMVLDEYKVLYNRAKAEVDEDGIQVIENVSMFTYDAETGKLYYKLRG